MNTKLLETEKANKVYDVLVEMGGADENERENFIHQHCTDKMGCMEWRFSGKLGCGGKYRSTWNGVSYYSEDETTERLVLAAEMNEKLRMI